MKHRSAILVALLTLAPLAAALPQVGVWAPAAVDNYSGCDPTFMDVSFATPDLGVAVGDCLTVLLTEDGGASWARVGSSGDYGALYAADFESPAYGIAVGVSPINRPVALYSTDGGASWTFKSFCVTNASPIDGAAAVGDAVCYEGSLLDVRVLPDGSIQAVGRESYGQGFFAYSRTGGQSWTTYPWTMNALRGLDFAEDGLSGIAVGDLGQVWRTSDGGVNWVRGDAGTILDLFDVDVVSPTEAYAVGQDGIVLKSADGGASWLPVAAGLSTNLREVDFEGPGTGRVAGDLGVILRTVDGGVSWLPEPSGTMLTVEALGLTGDGGAFAGGSDYLIRYVPLTPPLL